MENIKKQAGRPRIYTEERLSELAESLTLWVKEQVASKKFAMLGDWCFQVGFNPRYFTRYAEQHEGFKEAYEWAKAWQEHAVSKGALNQSLNARFAQFFLGCQHEWRTKDQSDDRVLRNEFGKYLDAAKEEDE
jgi:hypothetical protein